MRMKRDALDDHLVMALFATALFQQTAAASYGLASRTCVH